MTQDQAKLRHVRVRFGEPVPEAMAELGGPQNAQNDHAIRDQTLSLLTPEHVDARTGELLWDIFLFDTPGLLQSRVFSLRWRSMVSVVV